MSGLGALKLAAATSAACLLVAAQAAAVVPSGNLVTNGDAEQGSGASDSTTVYSPPGWDVVPGPNVTGVRWGAPGGFPTTAQGAALGGGLNFFAGGPAQSGDNDSLGYRTRFIRENIAVPAQALADIDAGGIAAAFTACFGGYADQDDMVSANVAFRDQAASLLGSVMTVNGPTAAQRGGRTGLLPEGGTSSVPPNTRTITVQIGFQRAAGHKGTYNDGYADNISLSLVPPGGTLPSPNCSAQAPGGGSTPGGGGTPGGGNPGSGGGSSTTPFLLARGSSTAKFASGRVALKLKCNSHDACTGRVKLTVPSLPAQSSTVTLGTKSFTIGAGKTGTVKVRIASRVKKRLAGLSSRKLRRLKVTANVTLGRQSKKFSLRLKR